MHPFISFFLLRFHMEIIPYGICLSLSHLFHSMWSCLGWPISLQVVFFILFHGRVIFHGMYKYRLFFTHSSADGHLGCFHVLATVMSASVNIGRHVSFRMIVFSRYICPGVGLQDDAVALCLVFFNLRNSRTVLCGGCIHLHSHQLV